MAKKLKYGIIGCGGIAMQKHLPSISTLDDAEPVAFCDLVVSRAEKANQDFGGGKGKVFTDYRDLLKEDLDAVFVLTPNDSHSEISVAALNAQKHVMCEKPMAKSYAEAKAMLAARDKNKKLLTIGYQGRYRPDSLFLKQECEKGALGEIYFAKAIALRRRAVPTWGIFLNAEKQGGGPLIDIGTHSLDLALFMMNNYEPHYAVGTTYHKLNKDKNTGNAWGDWDPKLFTAEDSAFGFIVMKNGATIMLESSWAMNITWERENACALAGTKGGAEMLKNGDLLLNGVKNGKLYNLSPLLGAGGVAYYDGRNDKPADVEARVFRDAIRGKGKLYVQAEEALAVTRILEGIYRSAASGKPHYFDEE
ncbi:MAG: Gfo/Idh/MocA family oxidoreductase [Treponema sp.]|nr:Gfo/Idh/MocA family oxidoreductase [Treponema sp.]